MNTTVPLPKEFDFTLTDRPGTIWTVDAGDLAALPLAPLDRRGWTKNHGDGSSDLVTARWPSIGWAATARRTDRKITELARSVHLALLGSVPLDRPLYPNPVEFVAYEVLKRLGRLSYSSGHVAPGGSAYADLKLALEYLKTTEYRVPDFDSPFTILRDYELSGVNAGPSYAFFSGPFIRRLNTRPIPIALHSYSELSRGSSRALYCLLAAHRPHKRVELPAAEVMSRIGSSHSSVNGARIRQRLGTAHEELQKLGILTADPEIGKADGMWKVSYELSRPKPESFSSLPLPLINRVRNTADQFQIDIGSAVFARLAMEWGVVPEVAKSLAVRYPRSLSRAVAAAAMGLSRPQKTVPAMVVHQTRKPYTAPFNRADFETPWNHEDRWPGYIPARIRNRRLAVRQHTDGVAALRHASKRRAMELAICVGAGLDRWVMLGVQAVLHQLLLRLSPRAL